MTKKLLTGIQGGLRHVSSEGQNIAQSEANYPKGDHIMLLNDTHCFEVPKVNLFHG